MDLDISQRNDRIWKRTLVLIAALAAFLSELLFRPNYSAEFDLFNGFGLFPMPESLPATACEWVRLFSDTPIVGLVLLEGADLLHYLLVAVIFVALHFTIRRDDSWINLVGLATGLAGVLIFLTSNKAFYFYVLSQKYYQVNVIQRAELVKQAEQIISLYDPLSWTWMNVGKFLILLAGLLFSISMTRSVSFPLITGIIGILSNGIGLMYYPIITFLPAYFMLPTPISAPFRLIWHLLIGVGFIMIWRRNSFE